MSQLKVGSIVDASGGNTTTINTYTPTESNMMGKNRIINGDMRIDQRNAGASISITTSQYPVDRFSASIEQGSGHTGQRSTTAPAKFTNSLLITVGTGAAAAAGSVSRIFQGIEGFNVANLGWGTANAQTITLSFWVRSSLTGTFAGGVYNASANRTYVFTYTINAANTFEQKTVTISGDTSGTWATDNSAGMYVNWDLGSGSTYQGTAGSWAAGAAWATSGSVKLAATSGATWYITGVQLEVGSVATPFERRPYGTELALCQRYYQRITSETVYMTFGSGFNTSTTAGAYHIPFPVVMRTKPTALETTGTAADYQIVYLATAAACSSVPVFGVSSSNAIRVEAGVASGLTAGQGSMLRAGNLTTAYLGWSAEL